MIIFFSDKIIVVFRKYIILKIIVIYEFLIVVF